MSTETQNKDEDKIERREKNIPDFKALIENERKTFLCIRNNFDDEAKKT